MYENPYVRYVKEPFAIAFYSINLKIQQKSGFGFFFSSGSFDGIENERKSEVHQINVTHLMLSFVVVKIFFGWSMASFVWPMHSALPLQPSNVKRNGYSTPPTTTKKKREKKKKGWKQSGEKIA